MSNLLGALAVAVTDDIGRSMAAATDLPQTDAACLNLVAHHDGCSIRLLSEILGLTHPGTVRVVDRLAAGGLVERGSGPDGRTVGLHLTTTGRRRWTEQRDARAQRLDTAIDALSARQRDAVTSAIETLLGVLTVDDRHAEQICRFCDESSCPQENCPVTCAVGR